MRSEANAGVLAGWTGGASPPTFVLVQVVLQQRVDFAGNERLGARCLVL